ncbi:hypothetical protein [Neisseria sp.]|uniref:hypothetical protein n=1 Tax=Neisseria sp. TaxID=192066 RepID=UPI0026DAE511|nr:hypothetical protein [Neisseria sp.]MDO4906682.1 hypothetical protein [Neisseria sp.]
MGFAKIAVFIVNNFIYRKTKAFTSAKVKIFVNGICAFPAPERPQPNRAVRFLLRVFYSFVISAQTLIGKCLPALHNFRKKLPLSFACHIQTVMPVICYRCVNLPLCACFDETNASENGRTM